MGIAEFIGARLDEDENYARAALAEASTGKAIRVVDGKLAIMPSAASDMLTFHIVRHDPHRVLAEVRTWRAILAAQPPAEEVRNGFGLALGYILQTKAREYSDHPDWRHDGCWDG